MVVMDNCCRCCVEICQEIRSFYFLLKWRV